MGNAEHRPPPSEAQKREQAAGLCRAIEGICDSWDDAVAAEQARGYAAQSPGPRAAAGTVHPDAADPLHTRQMPAAPGKASAFGDQVGNRAILDDRASAWLDAANRSLRLLLAVSPVEIPVEHRWTGAFYPPNLRRTLCVAAEDVVQMWPRNIAVLIERIHGLANEARAEWPPTPRPGQVIQTPDGPVKVGERAPQVETCTECGGPVAGNAADPIRRVDGKPYHERPCWETARKRKQRVRGAAS